MTTLAPAVGLMLLGVAVAVIGATTPVTSPTATGPIATLVVPASRTLARSTAVGVGSIQVLGGLALAASGWSR